MYSSLDPTARKINTAKFVNKKVSVLTVTDVAARGIDIPSLDYVVNLHFPGKPKLFVHRVGRCARAGRTGTAFSIFSTDDAAHVLDLHLFLNRPFNINDDKVVGIAPQELMEEEHLSVTEVKNSHDIVSDKNFDNFRSDIQSIFCLFRLVYYVQVKTHIKNICRRVLWPQQNLMRALRKSNFSAAKT